MLVYVSPSSMLIWVLRSFQNKGMKSECKKFGENSRETASVSTICDEYCSPSQVSLHDSKHGEHTYRTKSSDP